MTTTMNTRDARREILNGLGVARRALLAARKKRALDAGLKHGASIFLVLVAVHFLWELLAALSGFPPPVLSAPALLGLAVLAAAAPIPVRVYFAGGEEIRAKEIAERVDLAVGNHNRIATALDLSRGRPDAFRAAAILDGLTALERARHVAPVAPSRRPPGFREIAQVYAGLLLLGLSAVGLIGGRGDIVPAPRGGTPPIQVASRHPPGPLSTDIPAPERTASPRETSEVEAAESTETPAVEGRVRSTGGATGKRVKASGRPGRGKSGEAREARQTSVSRGDPTEGTTPPAASPDRKRSLKRKKITREPTRARVVGKRRKEGEQMGATVGQGGSGGGAMSPVRSPWAQRDRTGDEPLPENPADEDVEDEIEEEEARGGTQPHMRDRKAATSRDLSISGPGEGGEGRGGPTPHKKARGTASLVLGVPVPDFVRGLLNPGTTKVTHERVEPVTSPGNTHPRASAVGRRGLEPRVRSARVAPGLRETVRRYLKALHAGRQDRE